MVTRAAIKPTLLIWARETAGLTEEDAAKKAAVSAERLQSWEVGETSPTINQLLKLAEVYRRPFSTFYLPSPPNEPVTPVHDFRQLPGRVAGELSSVLTLQLRKARERRQLALQIYEDIGEHAPELNITARMDESPEDVGERIREYFGITARVQQRWRQPYDALNGWRTCIEEAGVLVFQVSRVEISEMRGMSIADLPLPVILVNSKDAPAGRTFTMLHELAHILLRRSGICELDDDREGRPPEEQRLEVFCNHVAAAALVPLHQLRQEPLVRSSIPGSPVWDDFRLQELARNYGVSRFVILRRLLYAQLTSLAFYQQKQQEWEEALSHEEKKSGFVSPDRKALSESGRAFVRLVLQGYYRERLTLSDVSDYLGVKVQYVSKIEAALRNSVNV